MNVALTSALLHFLWQGAAIAFLLAVALTFAKSATLRYGLACLALLAMPVAFAVTFILALPPEPLPMRVPVFFTIPAALGSGNAAISVTPAPPGPVPLWMAGVALLYGYRFVGWLAAQRLRRRGVCAAPESWRERVTELAARIHLTRPVTLLESALAETVVTIGVWRPVILMPLGLLAGLPADQVEAILLHELAHIRRHDYLVNLSQALVEGLLFYHPATWWVSCTIRREREMCCDDVAAEASGDVLAYTHALAALEAHRVRVPILAATGGPLMLRIHRLLDRQAPLSHSAPALVFLVLAASAALFAFQPEPSPAPHPAPAPSPVPDPQPPAAPVAVPAPTPRATTQPDPIAEPAPAPPTAATGEESSVVQLRRLREAMLRREMETPYKQWMNEEVVWIISPEERTAFTHLATDAERRMFIEQFWLRRDPTPDTRVNELMEEHYRRVAWSNDKFGAAIPGWQTDRGMVYVKFGAPDEKEEHPFMSPTIEGEMRLPYERWRYKYLEGVGNDVILEFVDTNGDGEYRMTWDPNDKNVSLTCRGTACTTPGEPAQSTAPALRLNIFGQLQRFVTIRPRPAR